jgi:glycosyltransferase involved in cell wall biosynthesis
LIERLYAKYVWYGNSIEVSLRGRIAEVLFRLFRVDKVILKINEEDTQLILRRFPEVLIRNDDGRKKELQVTPARFILDRRGDSAAALFLEFINEAQSGCGLSIESKEPTFTIVIPFYSHLRYFEACLVSVADAVKYANNVRVDVLVVNDDPRVSVGELEALIPNRLRGLVRIISNMENAGISRTLNKAISEAQHNWIVHLDCDDMLAERTLGVLVERIRGYPLARYISSRMLDVDDSNLLRCRLRPERPEDLISHSMVAGHLKAIRRDLFGDIGSYLGTYEGCQDYEFALRVSVFEPLLFIPDYLYKYRWHRKTQSVDNARRQAETTDRIIQTYLLTGVLLKSPIEDLPLSLTFEGEHASDWQKGFCGGTAAHSTIWAVRVTVSGPPEARRRKLFGIKLARHLVDYGSWTCGSETRLSF